MTKPFYKVRDFHDLRELLAQSVSLFGDRPAFEIKNSDGEHYEITYNEYQRIINCLGTALMDMGYAGARVAVAGENCFEWCASYMSVINGVGVVVPIDKELMFDDFNGILRAAEARLIFCDMRVATKLHEREEELDDSLEFVYFSYDGDSDGVMTFESLVEHGAALLAKGDTRYLDVPINPEAMSTLLFTSGTTGAAKGVMLCHRNFCSEVRLGMQVIKIHPEDCGISMLPLHHTYESTIILFFAPYCGAKVTFCEGYKYVLKNMKEFNPTVFVSVPLLLENVHRRILKAIAAKPNGEKKFKLGKTLCKIGSHIGIDLRRVFFKEIQETFGGHMRLIICGAAPIDPQILKDFEAFGIQIIFGYGLTECAPLCICNNDKMHLAESIGVPLPETEAKVFDPDPETGIGEICIRGPMVMLGYYNNPEETAKVIDADGFFHTGDLGRVDNKGRYYLSGRCKNVIVTSNGKNVFPEELEFHLGKEPVVEECLVVGDTDGKGKTIVKAKIFPNLDEVRAALGKNETDEVSDDELKTIIGNVIKRVNNVLPGYKRISDFIVRRTEFIKTTTQKIQRHKNNED